VKPDRRSGIDRRAASRFTLLLDVKYEDHNGPHTGTLSDISPEGCFIMGSGEIQDGDDVRIFLPLSDGMSVRFDGVVVNHVLEIGFAANFTNLTPVQEEFLVSFIDMHKDSLPGKRG
jgi:hypothetical protein